MNDILKEVNSFEDILSKEFMKKCKTINAAGTLNSTDVKTVMDAVCLMLKIGEFREWMEGEEDPEYSNRGYSMRHNSYRRGRDAMTGRYVSRSDGRSYRNNFYDRMSMDDGYSQHSIKDRMIANLENMMDEAGGEHERQVIGEWINRLEMDK